MGLLERVAERRAAPARPEARALAVPWRPWDSRYVPFSAGGPAHPSAMAVGLDHALQLAPLYAGARLLADMVASLPLKQYRKTGLGRPQPMTLGSLFARPAAYGTVYDWVHMAMVSLVLTGNAWGLITSRDGYGFPTSIEWLPPDRIQTVDDQEQPWNPLRSRIYFYGREMAKGELFHVRAFAVPGKVEAMSPMRLFIELIQSGQDALGYGASWYRSGGFPPGTFQNQEIEVAQTDADEIRRRLTQTIQRREPLVYGRDWDYKPITVPPSEAQFIDAMQLNATQIAAVLGVPPERIGGTRADSLTYTNVEQNQIELLTDTVRPWLVRLETAFFDCLPEQQYVKFDEAAMLRTTTEQRFNIWKVARDMGLLTANEIRRREEWDDLPGGIGDDPIPQEVLIAMARSIKEIPKSYADLIEPGPVDKVAIQIAQATGQVPTAGTGALGALESQNEGGGGSGGDYGATTSGPASSLSHAVNAASGRGRDIWTRRPDYDAAAAAARKRWAGDYDLDPAAIRRLMNGAMAH